MGDTLNQMLAGGIRGLKTVHGLGKKLSTNTNAIPIN